MPQGHVEQPGYGDSYSAGSAVMSADPCLYGGAGSGGLKVEEQQRAGRHDCWNKRQAGDRKDRSHLAHV